MLTDAVRQWEGVPKSADKGLGSLRAHGARWATIEVMAVASMTQIHTHKQT